MTLFFLVAKAVICRELEAKITASRAKEDQKILFIVPVIQNKDLAIIKRNFLSQLSTTIAQLHEVGEDLDAAKKLNAELTTCRTKTADAASQNSQSTSATEVLLDRLKTFVTAFYQKLKQLNLLNQPQETGTFYTFLHAVASYHADRIFEKTISPGFFANPNLTCINEYHKIIDALVDERLSVALENLKGQNQNDAAYTQRKHDLGILNIEFLILKNNEIRSNYMTTLTNVLSWLPAVLDRHLDTAALALPSKISPVVGEVVDREVLDLEGEALSPCDEAACDF